MRVNENKKNKGFLKKLFIKLCRKLGFEIIDQNNLYIPTLEKYANENLSELQKHSISIPLGKVKITRRVSELTLIIRSYTSTEIDKSKIMLDQNKSRIFEKSKIEYTLRTINSLILSCKIALNEFPNLKLNFLVTDDNSSKENLLLIEKLLNASGLNTKLIKLQKNEFEEKIKKKDTKGNEISKAMISNMRNILKSLYLTKTDVKDLVYFVEDDYIHNKDSIIEMIFTYERVASQIKNELIICPTDYPYLYTKAEATQNFLGHKYHWRRINETLCTFLTSKEIIEKYWDNYTNMCKIEHAPFEKPMHDIYEKELCISPIPSLALHFTNINSIFGLSPNINWKKIWEESK